MIKGASSSPHTAPSREALDEGDRFELDPGVERAAVLSIPVLARPRRQREKREEPSAPTAGGGSGGDHTSSEEGADASTERKLHLLNLVKFPRHLQHSLASHECSTRATLHVIDGCIVVVDSVEGVGATSQEQLQRTLHSRVKRCLFFNKVDRPGTGATDGARGDVPDLSPNFGES